MKCRANNKHKIKKFISKHKKACIAALISAILSPFLVNIFSHVIINNLPPKINDPQIYGSIEVGQKNFISSNNLNSELVSSKINESKSEDKISFPPNLFIAGRFFLPDGIWGDIKGAEFSDYSPLVGSEIDFSDSVDISHIYTRLNNRDTALYTVSTKSSFSFEYLLHNNNDYPMTIQSINIIVNDYNPIEVINGVLNGSSGAPSKEPTYYYCYIDPNKNQNPCYLLDYTRYSEDYDSYFKEDGDSLDYVNGPVMDIYSYISDNFIEIDAYSSDDQIIYINVLEEGIYNLTVSIKVIINGTTKVIDDNIIEIAVIDPNHLMEVCESLPFNSF